MKENQINSYFRKHKKQKQKQLKEKPQWISINTVFIVFPSFDFSSGIKCTSQKQHSRRVQYDERNNNNNKQLKKTITINNNWMQA